MKTPEQALQVIDHALSQINTSRQQHQLFGQAIKLLSDVVKELGSAEPAAPK